MVKGIPRRLRSVLLCGAFGAPACSLVAEADRSQCATTADCAERGGAFDATACVDGYCRAPAEVAGGGAGEAGAGGGAVPPPPLPAQWACLEATPPPAAEVPAEVSIALNFQRYGTNAPMVGLRLNVCRRLDPSCLSPVTTAVSGADGRATFRVPTAGGGAGLAPGFSGFVEANPPADGSGDDLMRTLVFFQPPVAADQVDPPYLTLTTFRRSEFASLVELSAGAYDPARGHVILAAQGCDGLPAAGVHYEADAPEAGMASFYMASGLPSTAARQTDISGIGGFTKAPVRFMTITGSVWDEAYGGPLAKIADVQVQTRADWATVTRIVPATRQP